MNLLYRRLNPDDRFNSTRNRGIDKFLLAKIPVVFCGVNHSAERYGYPYEYATGIIEVDPIDKLIYSLKVIFSLDRIHPVETVGYLAEDSTSSRINGEIFKNRLRFNCIEYYVQSAEHWQWNYQKAQEEVDLLIIGNVSAIDDWNENEAKASIFNNTKIPTGSLLDFMAPYSLISCIKLPSVQGSWAAETALKILNGAKINEIPVAEPKKGKLIVNLKIANVLGIEIPTSYLEKANELIE